MTTDLVPVKVDGTGTLLVCRDDKETWVAIAPAAEMWGKKAAWQLAKLRKEPWAVVDTRYHTAADGRLRPMTVVNLATYRRWLWTLPVARMSDEQRERLRRMQDQFDVVVAAAITAAFNTPETAAAVIAAATLATRSAVLGPATPATLAPAPAHRDPQLATLVDTVTGALREHTAALATVARLEAEVEKSKAAYAAFVETVTAQLVDIVKEHNTFVGFYQAMDRGVNDWRFNGRVPPPIAETAKLLEGDVPVVWREPPAPQPAADVATWVPDVTLQEYIETTGWYPADPRWYEHHHSLLDAWCRKYRIPRAPVAQPGHIGRRYPRPALDFAFDHAFARNG